MLFSFRSADAAKYPRLSSVQTIELAFARDWNAPHSGVGYVTRFQVRREFMELYPLQRVGADIHMEWWIPAEDLNALNDNIVGLIEVIAEFRKEGEDAATHDTPGPPSVN